MTKSKPIIIAGGIALAVGAIWYIKKSEQPQEEFIPTTGPKTYASSQEASGNLGGFNTGGGAPSTTAPGVVTAHKVGPVEGVGVQNEKRILERYAPPVPIPPTPEIQQFLNNQRELFKKHA